MNMGQITTTDQNFKEMLNQHSRVVVKYYADWCGKYCTHEYRYECNDAHGVNPDILNLYHDLSEVYRRIFRLFKNLTEHEGIFAQLEKETFNHH